MAFSIHAYIACAHVTLLLLLPPLFGVPIASAVFRYSVGMAVSCYQKGRMVLVSADKPPEIGFNLFDSTDGGRNWANMTDYVADAVNSLTGFAPGVLEHAPVAMFVPGKKCEAYQLPLFSVSSLCHPQCTACGRCRNTDLLVTDNSWRSWRA